MGALIDASAALNFADSSFGDTEMAQPEEPGDHALCGPAHMIETLNKVVRTSQQMLPEIGRQPTSEELAEKSRCRSTRCTGSWRSPIGRFVLRRR
jgi:Sigma-70 region 3